MKLVVLAVAGLAAAAAAAGLVAPVRAASSAPPCIPKTTTVNGHIETAFCGPATATLKIGPKTYNFKGGYCRKDPKLKIALQLLLGTILQRKPPVNGGKPLFELTLEATTLEIGSVNADYGGKRVVPRGIISVKGSIPSLGTFKAYASSIPAHLSGSWNCHGVVWNQAG